MVDYHSHILAGIDDGAKTVEESLQMLSVLTRFGFSDVVLTPHYYSNRQPVEEFTEKRGRALLRLLEAAEGKGLPTLHVGAEVYFTELLFNNEDLKPLTVGGRGVFMLTELPYDNRLSLSCEKSLQRLIYDRGITPVLAHIERYPFLMEEKTLIPLLKMGCRAQVNYRAFTLPHRNRKLENLIKKGHVSIFGTDAHSAPGLEDWLKEALANMDRIFGAGFAEGVRKS